MIKDGTGQRKMEQGTNEDTGVGYCGLHVTIQLDSVWLLCLWTQIFSLSFYCVALFMFHLNISKEIEPSRWFILHTAVI